ncbi:MarR family winged helix-turn-helix transcriptional regulator [Streptomyces sp. NPDC060085]|uniref:MarR family winged helix-turn-helix transcriptional regulator n=1 Tax=Streptomyces sp. NPDC060085 TaxID=3347054 RepID=UPI0036581F02
MTDRTWPTPDDDLRDAAQQACGTAEIFDLLWEQDRNEGPPPYIPVSQVRVLSIVGREYGIGMRALTRLLGAARRPSVCRLIDRLQALGFVERQPCPDSGREVLLTLTGAGRRHLEQLRACREELLLQALGMMPAHQRTAMTEGVACLQNVLLDQPTLRLAPEDAPLSPCRRGRRSPRDHRTRRPAAPPLARGATPLLCRA